MKSTKSYGMLLGAGALGGAVIVLGLAVTRALVGGPAEEAVPDAYESAGAVAGEPTQEEAAPEVATGAQRAAPGGVAWEEVQLAAELAPFEENRQWSGERYRLPGEPVFFQEDAPQPQREIAPPPAFQVLGTASSGAGGLAVIRVGTGTPQLLAPGQQIDGYRVSSIEDGRVVMSNQDRTLSLAVAEAQPNGPALSERQREQAQGNRAGNYATRGAQATRAAQLTNAQAQQMARRLEQAVTSMGPGTQVQMGPNGETIMTNPSTGQRTVLFGNPPPAPPAAAGGTARSGAGRAAGPAQDAVMVPFEAPVRGNSRERQR